jgi:hypothetical protein
MSQLSSFRPLPSASHMTTTKAEQKQPAVELNGGGYGIGLAYSRNMIHPAG